MKNQTQNQIFSASWDKAMWITNIAVIILLTTITATILIAALHTVKDSKPTAIFMLAISFLPMAILFLMAMLAPQKYIITPDTVIIKRCMKSIKIPLPNINSIQPTTYKYAFKKSLRIFGSGGGFGIYGSFKSANLKRFKAYMTRRSNLIMIKTHKDIFVITPDKPEKFINIIESTK